MIFFVIFVPFVYFAGNKFVFGERNFEFLNRRLSGDFQLVFKLVHKQIFFPFGFRFRVVTEQHAVESKLEKFLRREQRHSGLIGRAVAFALVAFDARRNEVVRGAFAALRSRQNVIERQIFGVFVVAAVLTAVAVANVNSGALHRRFLPFALDVNIRSQAHDRRHGNHGRR